ncbi:MAG: hypothetical protein Q8P41_26390 [Pseudomonadota bacterium]|nr:hypothetical protein [Pseudomonadota bacterium]
MSSFPWEVLILGVVLGVNRLATPATYERPIAFWAIQVMNVAVALPVALVGIPGTEGFPALGWLIAGLLLFHVLQNVSLRGTALARKRQALAAREQARKLRALEAPAALPRSDTPLPGTPPSDAPLPGTPAEAPAEKPPAE